MIQVYETFEELADAMCRGEGPLHFNNCPEGRGGGDCISWQHGVRDFAEWLDHIGATVSIPDKAEDFYEFTAKRLDNTR